MDKMKGKIKELLVATTDEIFLEWQSKLHITSGDNDPWDVMVFNHTLDQLTDLMVDMLNKQPKLKITDIGMGDISYPADELANDYETFNLLRQLQEKIEEKHYGK